MHINDTVLLFVRCTELQHMVNKTWFC